MDKTVVLCDYANCLVNYNVRFNKHFIYLKNHYKRLENHFNYLYEDKDCFNKLEKRFESDTSLD